MATKTSSRGKSSSNRKRTAKSKGTAKPKGKDSKKLFNRLQDKVHIDDTTRVFLDRDNPALIGHFCTVTKGEYSGRYGVLDSVASYDDDGFPKDIIFVPRNSPERIVIPYDDVEGAESGNLR